MIKFKLKPNVKVYSYHSDSWLTATPNVLNMTLRGKPDNDIIDFQVGQFKYKVKLEDVEIIKGE